MTQHEYIFIAISVVLGLTMLDTPPLPSFGFPILGGGLMALMMLFPRWFKWLSVVFTGYTILILCLTA